MQVLRLEFNQIGDTGMIKLSEALGNGALASLEKLYLNNNSIGDDGLKALAEACASGALASLKALYLYQDAPAVKAACQARGITFF